MGTSPGTSFWVQVSNAKLETKAITQAWQNSEGQMREVRTWF